MNRDELIAFIKAFDADGAALVRAKNHDYAGESGETPFANFEACEWLGICSTEIGMLVRMCDKFMRLIQFVKSGRLEVKDEAIRDTLLDSANYDKLLAAYLSAEGATHET